MEAEADKLVYMTDPLSQGPSLVTGGTGPQKNLEPKAEVTHTLISLSPLRFQADQAASGSSLSPSAGVSAVGLGQERTLTTSEATSFPFCSFMLVRLLEQHGGSQLAALPHVSGEQHSAGDPQSPKS